MEKNVPAYIFKELIDIRMIILFVLEKAFQPLTSEQISQIITENTTINYFETHDQVNELIKLGEIKKYIGMEDITLFEITEQGRETVEFFHKKIPLSVREILETQICHMFKREKAARSIYADILPVNLHEFAAECNICDEDIPLLKVTVYTGTKESAKEVCENFKNNTTEIYQNILNILFSNNMKDKK